MVVPPCSGSLSLLLRPVLLDEISLPFDPASSQRAFLTDFSISHQFWDLENNHAEEMEALEEAQGVSGHPSMGHSVSLSGALAGIRQKTLLPPLKLVNAAAVCSLTAFCGLGGQPCCDPGGCCRVLGEPTGAHCFISHLSVGSASLPSPSASAAAAQAAAL